jgi:hypothetical protein
MGGEADAGAEAEAWAEAESGAATGRPTHWGFWNPTLVNDDPEHYSERGANSIGILAYLASAFSITGDQRYQLKFWDLANNFGYLYNAVNGKVDNPVEDNHSDNELIFQTYHILCYALQRLDKGLLAYCLFVYLLNVNVNVTSFLSPLHLQLLLLLQNYCLSFARRFLLLLLFAAAR